MSRKPSEKGFSLIEVMVAGVILAVGLLGLAYVYGIGTMDVVYSQQMAIARQKAREAVEDIMAARTTATLTWDQINNVSNGGVFLDGAQPLKNPGPDGIVDTADDGTSALVPEFDSIIVPGANGLISSGNGTAEALSNFTRQVQITSINSDLKQITVTITYVTPRGVTRSYQMSCYVSPYV
ncbi:MAG: type IV pilus modification PilV family protein [Terriglobia bacterium]